MASKRQNMLHKNKTEDTGGVIACPADPPTLDVQAPFDRDAVGEAAAGQRAIWVGEKHFITAHSHLARIPNWAGRGSAAQRKLQGRPPPRPVIRAGTHPKRPDNGSLANPSTFSLVHKTFPTSIPVLQPLSAGGRFGKVTSLTKYVFTWKKKRCVCI
ncbi:hypothetical protein AAG570_001790 [Ranatra chinensis]|uniref:Uncharacterized protein n=1 Tax=Ranatra chinensis TaxID=642074 RepID=A0ABD0Y9J2_9HEMI